MKDFKNKVAVITGGGSGIGEGIATVLSREGAHVVIADLIPERVEHAVQRLRERTDARVLGVVTDVSDQASVNSLADAVYAEFGRVNLLFNNVGTSSIGTSWETLLADWHRVIDVNLFGCVHGIQTFVPRMLAGGEEGCIINTSSMAGLGPVPLKAPYTASKYAIVGLSRTLAGELEAAKANIRVVVVCPGPVATTMVNDSIGVLGAGVGTAELELLVTLRDLCNLGISGEDAGEIIVGAIRANRFWVLPNAGEFQAGVESAHRTMMLEGFGQL